MGNLKAKIKKLIDCVVNNVNKQKIVVTVMRFIGKLPPTSESKFWLKIVLIRIHDKANMYLVYQVVGTGTNN
jgi:hypothetical protein